MITIKEIAEKAGVSPGTVDRVLHGRGRVSAENVEKVRRIADEYGYVPNQLARRLQRSRHLSFGVLIPDPETEYGYWQQVVDGVEEARKEIETLDADIVYSFFDRRDPDSFRAAAAHMFSRSVSAYIAAPIVADGMREAASAHPEIPYAFIDSSLPDLSPLWDFSQNPVAAGRTGARLMALSGPSLPFVMTMQTHRGAFNGEMRAAAFTAAMERTDSSVRVVNCYAESPDGMRSALLSADLPCDHDFGIFIVSDQASILSSVLEDMGLLSRARIVGFDLSAENRKCLEHGMVFAIIGQRPRAQGHDAVMALFNHFSLSAENAGSLPAPVDIYIKENIPDSDHWL